MRFSYQKTGRVAQTEVKKLAAKLKPYLAELDKAAQDFNYGSAEACLALPFDKKLVGLVRDQAEKKKSFHLSEVMVIGIGGSVLGCQAVYRALRPQGEHLSFYDTVDNHRLIEGIETINRVTAEEREVLIIIISKSGSTMETLANARVLIKTLKDRTTDWQKQVLVISEPESALTKWAKELGIETLPIPPNVGGRFSVMSPVALYPLALSGVDIAGLCKGAGDAVLAAAAESAATIYANLEQGKNIYDLFLFDTDLEDLGKWHRQLYGESLGKSGKGITPTVSIGSSDLHSVFQLYVAGPKDKFTTFVTLNRNERVKVPKVDTKLDALAPYISGKTIPEIMQAIVSGVKEAYKKNGLPFTETDIESDSARELGAWMQFKLAEVMCLAKLMGVDAFGQARVEEYKKITKEFLLAHK